MINFTYCDKFRLEKEIVNNPKYSSKKYVGAAELLIKKILQSTNGAYLEQFLKEIVASFHNRECTTYRQMVRGLNSKDNSGYGALTVITSVINGQRGSCTFTLQYYEF